MPAVLSGDLSAGAVIPLAHPHGALALWRSGSGKVAAFADRCPHRGMRLSHGFVRGEALSCIYHGWSYGEGGRCLRIPAHPGLTPPDAIRVDSRSVAEADGLVWVAGPQSPPPNLGSSVPLRSLTAEASLSAVEAAADAYADALGFIDTEGLRLLVAALAEGRTLIHVLVERDADTGCRVAASRAAEALRREAEAIERLGGGA